MVIVESAPTTLDGGYTYEIQSCSGNTGEKTIQLSGDRTDCLSWFAESVDWNTGAWWGGCKGQLSVTFPITVTVPGNSSLEITACW